MPKLFCRLGIVTVSRKPVTRWGKRGLAPHSVLPDVPATPAGERLSPPGDVELYYAGDFQLMLYSGEAAHYRDNLFAKPTLWVAMRPDDPKGVVMLTADPYEGEARAGEEALVVAALPMPPSVALWVEGFMSLHYKEEVFVKRKRKRADPDALTRGGKRVLDKDEFLP